VAGYFVAEYQRHLGNASELRPVAISHVKIGMAHATRFHGNQDFAGTRLRARNFGDQERLLEFLENGSSHTLTANSANWKKDFMNRAI